MGNKIIINENQENILKLPKFIYKAIANKYTSLGDNPALPSYGEFGFEYEIIKKRFAEVSETIDGMFNRGEIESKDPDYLVTYLGKLISKCKKIEKTIKPQLEKLCENIVNDTLAIPTDTVLLKCELVDNVKPKHEMRILPENGDNSGYDFEDIDEIELMNKTVLKRRFVNALIQGFSSLYSREIDDWYDDVHNLNEKLWGLWYYIRVINDYLLFVKEEKIDDKNNMQTSYVEVHLGKQWKKTIITAQGIVFPYLLKETFKGFFELFSSHGLPEDNDKAMYIIRKADFLVAEPWDIRLGTPIVDRMVDVAKMNENDVIFDSRKMPYFFTKLCELPTEAFNIAVKNILSATKKGARILDDFNYEITHDIEYQEFKDKIQQKNIETSLITDDCFTKEELNDYVIQENETDEMMAYHGTGANFDKFNHKKYLNTGAGSQSFGWGTYVTNDEAVAGGYADNAKHVSGDKEEAMKQYLMDKYGYDEFKAEQEASDIAYNFRWAGSLSEFIELCKKSIEADWETPERKEMNKRWLDVLSNLPTNDSYIYEVDIPEDNGTNYIEWYEHFPPEMMKRVIRGIFYLKPSILERIAKANYPFSQTLYHYSQTDNKEAMIDLLTKNEKYDAFFASSFYSGEKETKGSNVYSRLNSLFRSDKAASLFLLHCGFDGIKYPSGTKWQKPDGASENAYNYVIFDANKVKIVNKTVK